MNIEIEWKTKEEITRLEDINFWRFHDVHRLLIVEDFEDITHYFNLDSIEGFTIEGDTDA